jgi:hypothetical protein
MTAAKPEVVLIGPLKPVVVKGLDAIGTIHNTHCRAFRRASHRLQRYGL